MKHAVITAILVLAASLLLSACGPEVREAPRTNIAHESSLQALLEQSGESLDAGVVQLFRSPSGVVIGDAQRMSEEALLQEPPAEVLALADTLERGDWQATDDGWVALGTTPDDDSQHFLVNYRGIELVFDGEAIIAQFGKKITLPDGTEQRTLDMIMLREGQYAYLNGRGNFVFGVQPEALPALSGAGASGQKTFAITPDANPMVRLQTDRGIIEIELFEDDQPLAVAAFLLLVQEGYWNTGECISYRVEPFSGQEGGENLRIAQLGTPSFRSPLSIPLPPSEQAADHDYASVAMVSQNGKLLPGHLFIQLDERTVDAASWDERFPVIGKVRKGFDLERVRKGDVSGPGVRYTMAAKALRPGDAITGATVVQQRYIDYSQVFLDRLQAATAEPEDEPSPAE